MEQPLGLFEVLLPDVVSHLCYVTTYNNHQNSPIFHVSCSFEDGRAVIISVNEPSLLTYPQIFLASHLILPFFKEIFPSYLSILKELKNTRN